MRHPIETAPRDGSWIIGVTTHDAEEPCRWITDDDKDEEFGSNQWGRDGGIRFRLKGWKPLRVEVAVMSTENRFTPGPWEVGDLDRNGQRIVRGEHIEVATCWHHSVGSIEKQMEANARLIAAAPALYEALKGLDSVGQEIEGEIDSQTYDYAKTFHGDIPDDAEFNVNLTWKHIHALSAAINKARAALSAANSEAK